MRHSSVVNAKILNTYQTNIVCAELSALEKKWNSALSVSDDFLFDLMQIKTKGGMFDKITIIRYFSS